MFYVTESALDFALSHLSAKGDTDVLAPAFEFSAIAHDWDAIRNQLASEDLDLWTVRPLRTFLSPKRGLGFRVATQLDPLDALLVTAVIYEMAPELESARLSPETQVVHSYRFEPGSGGQLYSLDWTFESFRLASLRMATNRDGLVVMADIADFFPRLYLHRIENALQVACAKPDHVRIVNKLLLGWNQSVSYGIPVGPSVFRLLAEVTIDDVDRALLSEGYAFCRYSDDYRIFVPDERRAREACAFLANTLHRHHGLTLQESKMEILPAARFIARFERTEEDETRQRMRDSFGELLAELQAREERDIEEAVERGELDRWALGSGLDTYSDIDYEDLDEDQKAIVDGLNLWQVLRQQLEADTPLDIPLTRFVLKRIAQLGLQDEDDLLLRDFKRLYPVFPHVIRALAVQGAHDANQRRELGAKLLALFNHPVVGHLEYHRHWILSVFGSDAGWNQTDRLMRCYQDYSDALTRPGIVTALGNARVIHWVRGRKHDVSAMPPWEKRAYLAAARCLPKDEVRHWYRSVLPQLDPLERIVVKWALDQL